MADEKVLTFRIDVSGVSNEDNELAKIGIQIKNIKKEMADLEKAARKGIASNEQIRQLAAYNKELGNLNAKQKELKNTANSASDSLVRMRSDLIKLKGDYANASGAIRTQMAPAILKLNNEILKAEGAIGVHQRNVGNYPQLLNQIPGPAGRVIDVLSKFGPIGTAIGGGLIAIATPLAAFFKATEEGVEMLERKVSGFKYSINVLKGDLAKLGKSMIGESGEDAIKWGNIFSKVGKAISTTANLIPGFSKYFEGLKDRMNEAAEAGENYARSLQEIEEVEIGLIVPRAKANLQIKEARLLYNDSTQSIDTRVNALKTALTIEQETAEEELKHQQWKTLTLRNANEELKKQGILRDEDNRALQESIAKELELKNDSVTKQIRLSATLKKARKELEGEGAISVVTPQLIEKEQEYKLMVDENAKWELDAINQANDDQFKAVVDANNKEIEAEKQKNKALEDLEQAHQAVKLQLAASVTNLINGIAGKNKGIQKASLIADKALAIAETIIQTKKANAATRAWGALAGPPGMILAEAAILKNNIASGINIASIVAATATALAGFARGGYTGKGGKFQPAGIVHKGEWVAPQEMVNDPRTGAIIASLESQRKSTIGGRSTPKTGYAFGGYVNPVPDIPASGFDYAQLARLMNSIQVTLDVNKLNAAQKELNIINQSNPI